MGLPPSAAGAVQETVACASPAVAATADGAAGAAACTTGGVTTGGVTTGGTTGIGVGGTTTTWAMAEMWPRPGGAPRVGSSAAYRTPAGLRARPLTLAKPEA